MVTSRYTKKLETTNFVEKPAKTQTSIRLASHLVRAKAPNYGSGGYEHKSPMRQNLSALTKSGKTLGVRSVCSGDPDVITWSCQSVWLRNTRSLAHHWQTHLPDATADDTSLLNQAHVQYQSGTGGSTIEKPAETQTSIRLASHIVREPNSRCGGHEFKTLMRQELGGLTKSGKTLGVRSFLFFDSSSAA